MLTVYLQLRGDTQSALRHDGGHRVGRKEQIRYKPVRTCASQNAPKQDNSGSEMPSTGSGAVGSAPDVSALSIWCSELPPTHVWMPNQPHATSALSSDGTLAPLRGGYGPGVVNSSIVIRYQNKSN
jgi:hypothetical protein